MTNEEWYTKVEKTWNHENARWLFNDIVREVFELHSPVMGNTLELCKECNQARKIEDAVITYPCQTIQIIEEGLK